MRRDDDYNGFSRRGRIPIQNWLFYNWEWIRIRRDFVEADRDIKIAPDRELGSDPITQQKRGYLGESVYYSIKSDVVKDALRTFLDKKENMRVAAAAELYKQGEVSLGKAAEIADMGIVEFKERLAELGVTRIIKAEQSRQEIQ